jgi:hypothetical protein
LAAAGWAGAVRRFPDPGDADHLARIRLGRPIPIEPEAERLARAAIRRRTDRRAAPGQVFTLARASDRARRVEAGDPGWQLELAGWVGDPRVRGTGVSRAVLPASPLTSSGAATALRRAGADLIVRRYRAGVLLSPATLAARVFGPGSMVRFFCSSALAGPHPCCNSLRCTNAAGLPMSSLSG